MVIEATPALLEEVVRIAEASGRALLAAFPGVIEASEDSIAIDYKGRRDLVTDADRSSEASILASLERIAPGVPQLSEERGDPGVRAGALWIVDPLDGTTNFAHGHPLWSVSIALCIDRTPVLAVVHAPRLGETWAALHGHGTRCNGRSVSVSGETALSRALLATGFSYERSELARGALEVFAGLLRDAREVRRGGSACLDLAHTASGVFSGFWEQHLGPHDVAAGALLVREAGGTVTDFLGGDDWLFGEKIVAGNPEIHRALLDRVSSLPQLRLDGSER